MINVTDEQTEEYTTKTLAKAAGVSDAYIRQLCIAGKLQAHKLGRDWLIPFTEGIRWLEERQSKQQEP